MRAIDRITTVPTATPATPAHIFCNQCGNKNPVHSKFCSNCGAKLETFT
ncbi:MAG: zinc-ribbon domain-containing protein [Calothrix sp. C42_A2020_038]|nr:zinc-ribbon domain-containing protein [Calothrix sp. C42_A2020_038]